MDTCIHPERDTGVTPEELMSEILSLTKPEQKELLKIWGELRCLKREKNS